MNETKRNESWQKQQWLRKRIQEVMITKLNSRFYPEIREIETCIKQAKEKKK